MKIGSAIYYMYRQVSGLELYLYTGWYILITLLYYEEFPKNRAYQPDGKNDIGKTENGLRTFSCFEYLDNYIISCSSFNIVVFIQ